jgi:hypothetical protein
MEESRRKYPSLSGFGMQVLIWLPLRMTLLENK